MKTTNDIIRTALVCCLLLLGPLLISVSHDHDDHSSHHDCLACVFTISFQAESADWVSLDNVVSNETESVFLIYQEVFPQDHFQSSHPSRAPPYSG